VKVADAGQTAFVGIGANLGDARATVGAALNALSVLPGTRLVTQSSLYASAPVDAEGPDFVNAVAELRCTLPPLALLRELQRIEADFGRERPYRNAPRTLDLDLLMFGERALDSAELVLPHPRAHLRAFVLVPLAELQPALCLPGIGPIAPWLERCAEQRVHKLAA
jgi:2-amino-4-hydroxy-6-hydroxymethyldihydropteridine diphosphokinase